MEATRVRISSLSLGLVDTNAYFIENDKGLIKKRNNKVIINYFYLTINYMIVFVYRMVVLG